MLLSQYLQMAFAFILALLISRIRLVWHIFVLSFSLEASSRSATRVCVTAAAGAPGRTRHHRDELDTVQSRARDRPRAPGGMCSL